MSLPPYSRSNLAAVLALAAGLTAFAVPPPASAAAREARKATPKAAAAATTAAPKASTRGRKSASSKKAAPAPAAPALAAATPEQMDAAQRVYYGYYDCEFKQSVDVSASAAHPHYVEVKGPSKGSESLMKPVLSSTGAIRLEDVKGALLMVQIASKSMLLNVKTGQRVVDDCVSPTQRELMLAAKRQKEADEAARAAGTVPAQATGAAGESGASGTAAGAGAGPAPSLLSPAQGSPMPAASTAPAMPAASAAPAMPAASSMTPTPPAEPAAAASVPAGR